MASPSRAQAGSYVIPLPGVTRSPFSAPTRIPRAPFLRLIDLIGRSYQISGRYAMPLPTLTFSTLTLKETFSVGFDYKYNKNSLEFGGAGAGTTLVRCRPVRRGL